MRSWAAFLPQLPLIFMAPALKERQWTRPGGDTEVPGGVPLRCWLALPPNPHSAGLPDKELAGW